MKQHSKSRRTFLGQSLALMGGAAFSGASFQSMASSNQGGYKALVCIHLGGGNDSVNMVIPNSPAEYQQYASLRQKLAVPQEAIRTIYPSTPQDGTYGMHPNMPGLQGLFNEGRMAVVANMGSLVAPMTKEEFNNKSVVRPKHLFSHNSQTQQWFTASPQQATRLGWAGRLGDEWQLSLVNAYGDLPMGVSASGNNMWLKGSDTLPYIMSRNGVINYNGMKTSRKGDVTRRALFETLLNQRNTNPMVSEYQQAQRQSIELSEEIGATLNALPRLNTRFPSTKLGKQLETIARMIQARDSFGMDRQCFFAKRGGFDTHARQAINQPVLLEDLDQSLTAFQNALDEIGAADQVVTFTSSDFGRSIGTNGDGTDHGWGAHHMVMGNAINGGDIYGQMPELNLEGPNAVRKGRLLPQFSVEQYAATIARWYGADEATLANLFPNLVNFTTSDLGFVSV